MSSVSSCDWLRSAGGRDRISSTCSSEPSVTRTYVPRVISARSQNDTRCAFCTRAMAPVEAAACLVLKRFRTSLLLPAITTGAA